MGILHEDDADLHYPDGAHRWLRTDTAIDGDVWSDRVRRHMAAHHGDHPDRPRADRVGLVEIGKLPAAPASIDPTLDRPVYRQLADILRARIRSGELAPDTLLPGEIYTAQQYRIGRESVRCALAVLRAEGLVSTCQGAGSRVRAPLDRHVVTLHPGDRVIARMPIGSERRDLGLPEGVPLLEITRSGGRRWQVLPADRVILAVAPLSVVRADTARADAGRLRAQPDR